MRLLIFSVLLVAVSAFPFEPALQDQTPSNPSPGEMTFQDQIEAIEKLMIKVIEDVHASEVGFVNHTEIEKPGGKIIDLIIEAAKPLKKLISAVMLDIHICHYKLAKTFMKNESQRKIELQAGQCFFVIHRPFVVLLRQALEKDLFGKIFDDKNGGNEKRGLYRLMHDLRKIQKTLGRFTDGKLDLPYVIKLLKVIKEGSEFFEEAGSLIGVFARDYIELGYKLLYKIHHNDIKGAQILAGRTYLSLMRRVAKVIAILKHSKGSNHHDNHRPTAGPSPGARTTKTSPGGVTTKKTPGPGGVTTKKTPGPGGVTTKKPTSGALQSDSQENHYMEALLDLIEKK